MYITERDIINYQGMGGTNAKGESLEEFLKKYNPNKYPNPSVTVDMAIWTVDGLNSLNRESLRDLIYNIKAGKSCEKSLKILLIKRGNHPYIGWWALPGGFVDYKEELKEAAYRELEEETGCTNALLTEVEVCGGVYRDPRTRVISVLYTGILDESELSYKAGDDASEAMLFDISMTEIECDKHNQDGKYTECKKYSLKLFNKESGVNVTADVECITRKSQFLDEIEYKVVREDGIGSDHAALILSAMDRLTRL